MQEAVAVAPEKSAQDHFHELRVWIQEHIGPFEPVARSAYQMSLSATIHRLIKFGPDETMNHLTARDLMNLLFFLNGELAEWVMRSAFTRALVEDDRLVYEKLANCVFMPECRAWYWKLVQGLIGAAPDPQEMTDWLNNLKPEEKSLARLLIVRAYPDLVHISWLDDVPKECPAIAYQLAQILSTKKDCAAYAERWVKERPMVRNQAFN